MLNNRTADSMSSIPLILDVPHVSLLGLWSRIVVLLSISLISKAYMGSLAAR